MPTPTIPAGFQPLEAGYQLNPGIQYNAIGVCTDFMEAKKTRGVDMTISFVLHDPSWHDESGLSVRFFHKDAARLPKITSTGDVVILRNVKNTVYHDRKVCFSNSASSWVILEHESVKISTQDDGSDIVIHQSGKGAYKAPHPSPLELQYAKAILALEHAANWRTPYTITTITENVPSAQRVEAVAMPKDKFALISDISVQPTQKGIFRDLLCEVRKTYNPGYGDRCELFVTDYTENQHLYDYKHSEIEEGMGFDCGDRFGYVDGTHKIWPGPWGKMTMNINCFPPHCHFVLEHVNLGDFVRLRNVQIKWDRDGTHLEGVCRTDQLYPDRLSVQSVSVSEAKTDEKLKELLKRKWNYEELCKAQNLRFIRDAKPIKDRKGKPDAGKENMPPNVEASKKNRDRKQQRKETKAKKAALASGATTAIGKQALTKQPATNRNVRCNNIDISLTQISTILDPTILARHTQAGNLYTLPFQNSVYRSRVRVVDFFPPSLTDFCVPIRDSEYGHLSDHESVSDVDPTQDKMDLDDADVRWEWCFVLLVEDAKPVPGIEPAQMELLVCARDGDFLLRQDACNLRVDSHALAKLRETLFHLWGDLQEQKEEVLQAQEDAMKQDEGRMLLQGEQGRNEPPELKPNGRPFECFIKEYGAPAEGEENAKEEDVESWERCFRLCFTTVSRE